MMPTWLSTAETIGFFALVVSFIGLMIAIAHNRMASWKQFEIRTGTLEIAFKQYQKDMQLFREVTQADLQAYLSATKTLITDYLRSCEVCRAGVDQHHVSMDRHVTPDMRVQITQLVEDMRAVKNILMER